MQQVVKVTYTTINFTRNSVMEVGAFSAAGWAWSARGRHATVGSGCGCGWLRVVVARQADLSGRLGATGRWASTGSILHKGFWHKAASPPHMNGSIIFTKWRHCATPSDNASMGPPESTSQTPSQSVQLFMQGSQLWQTKRPTNRLGYSVRNKAALLHCCLLLPGSQQLTKMYAVIKSFKGRVSNHATRWQNICAKIHCMRHGKIIKLMITFTQASHAVKAEKHFLEFRSISAQFIAYHYTWSPANSHFQTSAFSNP